MIRVDVLGGLRVTDGARVWQELPHQPMRAALLVMLAVDRTLTRDRVLAVLWPDRDAERGRRALNQTVYELRRTLGEGCIAANGEEIAAGDGVRSDVAAFEQALANGDVEAAVELYRGPFLAGFFLAPTNEFEDWCTRHRSRLARAVRKARLQCIDRLTRAGRTLDALAHAHRAVDEDPLEDEYQHCLVELLVAAGQRAAALRQYESYRVRLAHQGLAPLPHTTALIEGIRTGEDAAAPAAGAQPEPAAQTAPARTAAPPEPAARPATSVPRAPVRRRTRAAAAFAALLLGAAVLALVLRQRTTSEPTAAAAAELPQLTIVLFGDASAEPRYGYLARGISESLVHGLQRRVPRLRVVAVEQAQAHTAGVLPGATSNLRLDGTVAVDSDSVRVRVRLSDMATGELLRPIEVRRPWISELALIDSIVPAVIEQMQPVLGQQILKRQLRAGTRSAEAFALYLRAADAYEALARISEVGDDRGEERMIEHIDSLLAEADRADPSWSRIASLRARAARRRALVAASRDQDPASPRAAALINDALRHADEAVARDPGDADALTSRATVRHAATFISASPLGNEQRRAFLAGAEDDVHRAVSADPHTAEAWLLLANVHYANGEWRAAHGAARQALQTDAFLRSHSQILSQLAMTSFHLGRDDEAWRWCHEGLRRFPDGMFWVECRAYLFAYAQPPAVDSALALIPATSRWTRFQGLATVVELTAARALAAAGRRQEALDLLDESLRRGGEVGDVRFLLAPVHLALGDTATALSLIQEYARANVPNAAVLLGRPLAGLRDHPAYPRTPRRTR